MSVFEKLARITVSYIEKTGESTDGLGNTVYTYAAPTDRVAYSIGPHVVEHGSATDTETQVADVDVAMPKMVLSLKDRFAFDGDTYEVVGVRDMTRGFHGWQPGIVAELQRVV